MYQKQTAFYEQVTDQIEPGVATADGEEKQTSPQEWREDDDTDESILVRSIDDYPAWRQVRSILKLSISFNRNDCLPYRPYKRH